MWSLNLPKLNHRDHLCKCQKYITDNVPNKANRRTQENAAGDSL